MVTDVLCTLFWRRLAIKIINSVKNIKSIYLFFVKIKIDLIKTYTSLLTSYILRKFNQFQYRISEFDEIVTTFTPLKERQYGRGGSTPKNTNFTFTSLTLFNSKFQEFVSSR